MKKKLILYFSTIIVPNIILVVYAICYNWAEKFAQVTFNQTYKFLVEILGNVLFGVFLLIICKYAFKNNIKIKYRSEFLLGIIIMPIIYVIFKAVNSHSFLFLSFSAISQYFIFVGVYVGLFVYKIRHAISRK